MRASEQPTRFLLLHSETGGGHRRVAVAVAEALADGYGSRAEAGMVDVLAAYAPWPFRRLPDWYGAMLCAGGRVYGLGFQLLDGWRRVRTLSLFFWPLVRSGARRLLEEHPADVIVAFHPLAVHTLARAILEAGLSVPLVAVGTDLVVMHALWAHRAVCQYLVATETARTQVGRHGVNLARVQVTGLPVCRRVIEIAREDPATLRSRLGLDAKLPLVLVMGGGEGFGPLERVALTVGSAGLPAQVVVLTGRNERLHARLTRWSRKDRLQVQGFTHSVHEWMRAADLLVTKAGPVTLAEALVLGVPLVLWGAIPAQETPNVRLVTEAGAGVWAPEPGRTVSAVAELLNDPAAQRRMREQARGLACPKAAERVAMTLWNVAQRYGNPPMGLGSRRASAASIERLC